MPAADDSADDSPARPAGGTAAAAIAAFSTRLEALLGAERRLALGVSGGGDSMALLALAAAHASGRDLELSVLTVDHGLRPEAAAECELVARQCQRFGLAHHVLRVEGGFAPGNLQAEARDARYALMTGWMYDSGVPTLALAHTADDLAETLLLRLGRGSGVDGLAAMAEDSRLDPEGVSLRLLRPLLDWPRVRLREICRACGVAWAEDPSNQDERFRRTQARRALEALAPLGLTTERLIRTARSMRRARQALEAQTEALLRGETAADQTLGWIEIDVSGLAAAPDEIALRGLARCLRWVAGAPYPPRLDSLEAALAEMLAGGAGRSLHGCLLAPARASGRWTICREPSAAAAPATLGAAPVVWDGRFRVSSSALGLACGALGAQRLARIDQRENLPETWRSAPRAARLAAPAVWRVDAAETPIAAPAAGMAHRMVNAAFRAAFVS